MSRLSSSWVNTGDHNLSSRHVGGGMIVNNLCPVCGFARNSKQHKARGLRCGRELQARYAGEGK